MACKRSLPRSIHATDGYRRRSRIRVPSLSRPLPSLAKTEFSWTIPSVRTLSVACAITPCAIQ